jgi:acyl-CoA thioester hydrolase
MAALPTHTTHYRVTYRDCAIGNHIYYANYLAILEMARGEFFRSLGEAFTFRALSEEGVLFPVIECALRYKAPARYDDVLKIETTVSEARGVRIHFAYRITNQDGEMVLEATTFHACANRQDKPQRLPAALLERLQPSPTTS